MFSMSGAEDNNASSDSRSFVLEELLHKGVDIPALFFCGPARVPVAGYEQRLAGTPDRYIFVQNDRRQMCEEIISHFSCTSFTRSVPFLRTTSIFWRSFALRPNFLTRSLNV